MKKLGKYIITYILLIDIYLKLFLYIIYSNNNDLQILKKFIKFRTKYKRKLIDNKIINPYKANVTSHRLFHCSELQSNRLVSLLLEHYLGLAISD